MNGTGTIEALIVEVTVIVSTKSVFVVSAAIFDVAVKLKTAVLVAFAKKVVVSVMEGVVYPRYVVQKASRSFEVIISYASGIMRNATLPLDAGTSVNGPKYSIQ